MEKDDSSPVDREIEVSEFTFQILSDVHLEMRTTIPQIPIRAKILALCGDIGYPKSDIYKSFIKWSSENFELVFVITGNHEYYDKKTPMQEIDQMIRDMSREYRNIVFLNKEHKILRSGERRFLIFGATFWTDLTGSFYVKRLLNDYKEITILRSAPGEPRKRSPVSPIDITAIHKETLNALQKVIDKGNDMEIVILSHHLPSRKCLPRLDEYSPAYASNLERFLVKSVILWACGHSHSSIDTIFNGVRILSNQMGYPHEDGLTGYTDGLFVRL